MSIASSAETNTLNTIYPERSKISILSIDHGTEGRAPVALPTSTDPRRGLFGDQIYPAIKEISDCSGSGTAFEPDPDDFFIRDMTEMTKTMSSTAEMMTKLLLCVAMISLLVGGIGIMNIMLVSVTERTREIGLRMAVGAEPGDIMRQFLAEAVVLCLLGGTMGILLGRTGSYVISLALHWPTAVSVGAIVARCLFRQA